MSRVVRGSTHALTARPPTSAQATPSAARSAKVRAMSVLSGVTGAGVAMPQGGLGHLRAQRPGAPGARLERQPRCRGPRRPGAVAAGAVGPSRRRPRGTRAPARSVAEWRTWCQGGPSTACCERAAAADRGASSGTLAAARTAGKDREGPGKTGKDRSLGSGRRLPNWTRASTARRLRSRWRREVRKRYHGPPHVHLTGAGYDVLIVRESLACEGRWPPGLRLEILEWIRQCRAELMKEWRRWPP